MKEKIAYYFENWKTIPNLISFIRILLIPVFSVLFYKGQTVAAAIILALSGLSDLVDGKIARKLNQISNLGKMLDPIADKLTVFAIAIILYIKFSSASSSSLRAFSWVFLIFIIKDLLMLFAGLIMILFGLKPCAAEIFGKIATVAFYTVMVIVMAVGPEVGAMRSIYTLPDSAMMILVSLSAIATFVAFFSYVPDVIKQIKEKSKNKNNK